MMTRKRVGGRAGIALLEVLLAATVVGLGLGTSMQTLSSMARLQSRIEERQEARRLAQEILIEIQAPARGGGVTTEETGAFDPPFDDYRWRVERSDQNGDALFSLLSVTVESRDGERVIHRAYSLVPSS